MYQYKKAAETHKHFIWLILLIGLLLFSSIPAAASASGPAGATISGFYKQNGKTMYYKKGAPVTGEQKIGKYWYFFDANGVMRTGFREVPGKNKICYYNKKGHRVSGKQKIKGDDCFFNKKTGALESRIMNIIYVNQRQGILQKGRWTHLETVSARTYTGRLMRNCACGLDASSMAISALKNKLVLPTKFNSRKYGFDGFDYKYNHGVKATEKYGLHAKMQALTKKQMIQHLLKGHVVIVQVTRSIYGGGGNVHGGDTGATGHSHFILVHGYKDGKFAVADSNNTSQTYVMSGRLKNWSTFAHHLRCGKKKSFCVVWK